MAAKDPEITPITPFEVEQHLLALSSALEQTTNDLADAEEVLSEATRDLEIAMAHARMEISGDGKKHTVQEREDLALLACIGERQAHDTALVMTKALRGKINLLRTQVDIVRSIGTSMRASLEVL